MFLYTIQHVWDFPCFPFFRQKSPEIDAETQSKKIVEKSWSGHPFWEPKSMKIDAGKLEKRLNCEKNRFWKASFFHRFFDAFLDEFWAPQACTGGFPKSTFPRLFSFFFARASFLVDFRRFWIDFGRFWSILDRFGSIFYVFLKSIFT